MLAFRLRALLFFFVCLFVCVFPFDYIDEFVLLRSF